MTNLARAGGHSCSSRQRLAPMTKIRTGGSLKKPVSIPLSQWSYQRSRVPGRSILAVGPKSTSPSFVGWAVTLWGQGPMISFCDRANLLGRPVGDHSGEVERGADLLVVVPAGEVEHRDLHAIELVLVALGLPPVVEPGVLEHLAPVGERPADGLIHRQEGQVAVDLVPGDGVQVLEHVARREVMPGDIHGNRHAGGPLDERVGRSDHGDHRGQMRGLLDARRATGSWRCRSRPTVATLPVDQGSGPHHSIASKPSRPSST